LIIIIKLKQHQIETASDKLPLPSDAYWHSLEDVLTQYVRHNDNKFEYDHERIAHRKHIVVSQVRHIKKESNNLKGNLTGIDETDYLEYEDIEDFEQRILSLKPKDIRDGGVSERNLCKIKHKRKQGKILNPKTKIVKILI